MNTLESSDVSGSLADAVIAKMGQRQHGPSAGMGRSHGRPWRGIVEETPTIWVTWLVAMAKRLGQPVPTSITFGECEVRLAWVELTFGRRWYFLCPHCHKRFETLYALGGDVGCRRCMRLGYRSQAHRATSIWFMLDLLWKRGTPFGRRYSELEGTDIGWMMRQLRDRLAEQIDALFTGASIGGADDATNGRTESTGEGTA